MRNLEAAFLIGVEGTTEIWLVRHGDCYEDMAEGPDPGLSPVGRAQAERLGKRVRSLHPAAVYASPSARAMETARYITDDVKADARLVEMTFELGDAGEINFTEKPEDVAARLSEAIDEIASAHEGAFVVIVSHAAAILNYLTAVMRLEPGTLRLLPYYTSVSVVRTLGGRKMVGALGDVAHLE